ncbi:BMP family protein [Lacrimispora indolis]|uniref:BMP family protein n=1 Tax=Lacrimispora indolis TaxID=69825 RepID=UPI0003F8AEF4|nr:MULTISPECIES: BMP family protein [Lachnospiraceae]
MMKKSMFFKVTAMAAAALMSLSMAGCAGSTGSSADSQTTGAASQAASTEAAKGEAGTTAASQMAPEDYKVALLLPGTVNDKGWNQEAYEGLEQIEKEIGCQVTYSEKVAPTDYENVFRGYADQGFHLIIGHGYEFADAAMKVAPDYPDSMFCITSADIYQEPNVCSLENLNGEQGFLAGAVAAMATKSGVVGSVGGMEVPSIVYFNQGFVQGAAYVNPEVKALTAFTGDFDDAAKVKEQANAFIQQGADVITHDADAAGLGIFESAKEHDGVYTIGSVGDQYELLPEKTLTSATNQISKAILLAATYQVAGELEPISYKFGIKEEVIGLADFRDLKSVFTEEQLTELEEIQKRIVNGEIKIEVSAQ